MPSVQLTPRFSWIKPVLLVAALHALLISVVSQLGSRITESSLPAQAPLILRLQGAERLPPEQPPLEINQRLPSPPSSNLPVPDVVLLEPRAIKPPAEEPAPPQPEPKAEVAAPSRGLPASAPLNLTLPRGPSTRWGETLRDHRVASDDARGNSSILNLEDRIQAALGGSDQISEYRLADGSLRLRRGAACVMVRPNRASALDPSNASGQLRPRLVERC